MNPVGWGPVTPDPDPAPDGPGGSCPFSTGRLIDSPPRRPPAQRLDPTDEISPSQSSVPYQPWSP
jgi:hypothetical protein